MSATFQDEVAKINSEIISGVTEEMRQLQVCQSPFPCPNFQIKEIPEFKHFHLKAFYLGVTNEWLEAMALAMGIHKKVVFDQCQCQQYFSTLLSRVLAFSKQIQSAKLPKALQCIGEVAKLVQNTNTKVQQGGEKECFPLERNGQVLFLLLTEEKKKCI